MNEHVNRSWSDFAMVVAFAVSLATNLLLVRQIQHQNLQMATVRAMGRLAVGASAEGIDAESMQGRKVHLNLADGGVPTVLYSFSPQCGWCKRNLPNVRALIAGSRGRFRIIGVSTTSDGLEEYLQHAALAIPVIVNLSASSREALKLGGTPQTIVVSGEGRVLKNWLGAYGDGLRDEVGAFFKVALPGVLTAGDAR